MNKKTHLFIFVLCTIFHLKAAEDVQKEDADKKLTFLAQTLSHAGIAKVIVGLNNISQIEDLSTLARLCETYKKQTPRPDQILVQCFERGLCDTYAYLLLPLETRNIYITARRPRAYALAQERLTKFHLDSWPTVIAYYSPGARWLETAQKYCSDTSPAHNPAPPS